MPAQFPLNKFKVELRLASNRLQFLQAKHQSLATKARRDIALLLENSKVASAEIRVESIIREDLHVEAMEIVELFCELLCTRAGLIDQATTLDAGMGEAVHSVIYASTRIDVKELPHIRDMLAVKYGKDMVKSAMANADGLVNQKLLKKLCLDPPSSTLVQLYLKEIAAAYSVPWAPDGDNDDEGSPSFGLQEPAVSPSAKAESAEPEEPSDARDADDTKETGEPKASGDTKATGKPAGADSSKSAEPAKEAEQESDSDAGQLPSPPTKPVAKAKSPSPVATKPIAASTKPAAKPASKSDDLAAGDGVPTMEELQRRFSALK